MSGLCAVWAPPKQLSPVFGKSIFLGVEESKKLMPKVAKMPNGEQLKQTTLHVLNIREIVSSTKLSQLLSISDQLPKSR